jgi:PAS domain S-box-containing protein
MGTMEHEEQPTAARRANRPTDRPPSRFRLKEANEQLTLAALDAKEQAEESTDRYRELVEGLNAIVWEAEADPWQYTFLSQRAQAIFGYPVERWLAEPNFWMDLIHADDRQIVASQCRRASEEQRDFRVEFRALAADGRIFCMAMIAHLWQDRQARFRYRGLLLDISDAIRAETLQTLVTQQTAELLADRQQLRAMATELNLAEHRERAKLATVLHDHLAQLLVLGRMKLGQAKCTSGLVPECAALIQQTEEVLAKSLTYIRTLIADLNPPALRESSMLPALRWLAEQMQQYGLAVTIEAPESPDLSIPEEQKLLLYQSVRELLINISKHARTDRATVRLRYRAGHVCLEVRDEGCGCDLAAAGMATGTSSGFGLFSIRERMHTLNGRFELVSAPGQGTTATLTLPLGVS